MKVAIVGAGTIIFQDEGIGVYASKYLNENYDFKGDVTLVDGGVLGFQLMTYYQDYDKVLILDTITMNDEVGSIYNLPATELLGLGSYKQTAHEVEIVEMLEICSLLEKMAEVNIIGIVPEDIASVNIGLTQTLQQRFDAFINTALGELQRGGVEFSKKERYTPLSHIIESYASPSSEYKDGN
ncbi:MAG: HyaD/HybD family hydrogenase maturation endopeptidase [Epsilonproteobacteria bacterium]|nr:HyaD/HybD family hydrogenase maturation endopeptidase [Campylobacterota bacterium]